jgi:hypothetical protein
MFSVFDHVRATTGIGAGTDRRPRIHDLRHAFAVTILLDWYRTDQDVAGMLPRLSTYLGHREPRNTYWYMSAVPELRACAADRLAPVIGGGNPAMTLIAPTLQSFFTDRLARHTRASEHIIAAYRDTMRTLLAFIQQRTGTAPAKLDWAQLDAGTLLAFLDDLEHRRHNTIRTRNARLSDPVPVRLRVPAPPRACLVSCARSSLKIRSGRSGGRRPRRDAVEVVGRIEAAVLVSFGCHRHPPRSGIRRRAGVPVDVGRCYLKGT